jgi:PEP-CTERM motif
MKLVHCLAALSAAACVSGASADTRVVYDSARFVQVSSDVVELTGFGRGSNAASTPLGAFGALAGTYNFDNWVIDATGSLLFGNSGFSVGLNYIDESGVRFTEFFDVNAAGTQAVGSGTFTVRNQCPIASCLWLDIMGTQEAGGGAAGYGGTGSLFASVVPEPAAGALLLLGLAGVAAAARRRRSA